jgi:hypothetical protein
MFFFRKYVDDSTLDAIFMESILGKEIRNFAALAVFLSLP